MLLDQRRTTESIDLMQQHSSLHPAPRGRIQGSIPTANPTHETMQIPYWHRRLPDRRNALGSIPRILCLILKLSLFGLAAWALCDAGITHSLYAFYDPVSWLIPQQGTKIT